MSLENGILKTAGPVSSVIYPESDGLPMADNTKQFETIVSIKSNIELLHVNDPHVFVAGNLFWYPVEGDNTIRQAPDVLVAYGRPKGHRGSYQQWNEENIAPQVVFEILSPGNRKKEMDEKFAFYERYGVEEYYIYDPDRGRMLGWLRNDEAKLTPIARMIGWVSPRMDIHFSLAGKELKLEFPDGAPFLTFTELAQLREEAEAHALEELFARADVEEALVQSEQARVAAEERAAAEAEARTLLEAKLREAEEKLRKAGLL